MTHILPPPISYRNNVGKPENLFLHDGYEQRLENKWFDDRPFEDEFQKEVYQYARQVADKHEAISILDVGCGSGFKLITNFFDKLTLGIDVADTVLFANQRWPGREWATADLEIDSFPNHGLAICADVIEHFPDPSIIVEFLKRSAPGRIILSTPERDELCNGCHDGPPRNLHHVREWNYAEFHAYVASHFQIEEHFVCKGTQIVECAL